MTADWSASVEEGDDEAEDENLSSEDEEIDQERVTGENTDDEPLIATIIDKLTQQHLQWLSISWVQRTLSIGYQKAVRITNKLIERGVVAAIAEGKRGERRILLQYDQTEYPVEDENVAQSGVV